MSVSLRLFYSLHRKVLEKIAFVIIDLSFAEMPVVLCISAHRRKQYPIFTGSVVMPYDLSPVLVGL